VSVDSIPQIQVEVAGNRNRDIERKWQAGFFDLL